MTVGPAACAILAVVDVADKFAHDDPTTFSPVRTLARHCECESAPDRDAAR